MSTGTLHKMMLDWADRAMWGDGTMWGVILADVMAEPWLQAVIQLGCLGIVAFGAHHVLTKTFPGQQNMFLSELKEQRTLHNVTEQAAQEAFLAALEAQRKDFRETINQYHALTQEMAARIHELTVAITNNRCPQLKGGG